MSAAFYDAEIDERHGPAPGIHERVRRLTRRAHEGEGEAAAVEAAELFRGATGRERRQMAERLAGNAHRNAEAALLDCFLPGEPLARLASLEKMSHLRADLAGENPTALERLLAERIAFLWFALNCNENRLAGLPGSTTLRQHEHQARQVERLNRQYLAAVRALAAVRRPPGGPRISVNVEGNTVTVAPDPGGGKGGPSAMEILAPRVSPRN